MPREAQKKAACSPLTERYNQRVQVWKVGYSSFLIVVNTAMRTWYQLWFGCFHYGKKAPVIVWIWQ
jgi:hypothetical protein